MPPYSHVADGAVQLLTPSAPAPTRANKLELFRRRGSSSRSAPASGELEDTRTPPRKINRWQQLRGMAFKLTGLSSEFCVHEQPRGRRRRSRNLGGASHLLLLHHDFWLEAIDEKHRYGFHLRAFHDLWKHEMAEAAFSCEADDRNRSFFYWLDHGRGSGIELPDCGRDALDATRVQYCSPPQRRQFEVEFTQARIAFAECHTLVDTDSLSKWIFVLSQDDKLYVSRKVKGYFHHSSFLAGVPIVAAGKIYVSDGRVYAIEPHSGHFKPKLSSLTALCCVLRSHGVKVEEIHFIKPKKWRDPWPFGDDTWSATGLDYVSDSEDS